MNSLDTSYRRQLTNQLTSQLTTSATLNGNIHGDSPLDPRGQSQFSLAFDITILFLVLALLD
jgi:hypothetical protein